MDVNFSLQPYFIILRCLSGWSFSIHDRPDLNKAAEDRRARRHGISTTTPTGPRCPHATKFVPLTSVFEVIFEVTEHSSTASLSDQLQCKGDFIIHTFSSVVEHDHLKLIRCSTVIDYIHPVFKPLFPCYPRTSSPSRALTLFRHKHNIKTDPRSFTPTATVACSLLMVHHTITVAQILQYLHCQLASIHLPASQLRRLRRTDAQQTHFSCAGKLQQTRSTAPVIKKSIAHRSPPINLVTVH